MATADSVKAKLQGIIAKVNETTGNTDADLTTAVDALLAGFGQSGGGGDTILDRPFVSGSFTLAEDISNWNDKVLIEDVTSCGFSTDNIAAFLFRSEAVRSDEAGLWCSAYQTIRYGNTTSACGVCVSNGSSTSKRCGIKMSSKNLVVTFADVHCGYAGDTYCWIALKQRL